MSSMQYIKVCIPQESSVGPLFFSIYIHDLEHVTLYLFIGLNIDSNLDWTAHLYAVANIVSRVIGLLYNLIYIFPSYILLMIYNSLIPPHFNYSNIDTLQKS